VQAVLDLEGVVHIRIVDQAFPADGGAWLLEIHPHDEEEAVGHLFCQHLETLGVLVGGLQIVNGARADHYEQAVILAVENVAYHLAPVGDGLQCRGGQRNFTLQLLWRDEGHVGGNVKVVDW